MGTLREKRPGVWELRVSAGPDPLNAKKYHQPSRTVKARTKTEAKRLLHEFEVEVAQRGGGSGSTFEHLLRRWLELNQSEWKETTYETNDQCVRVNIIPALGSLALSKLTTEHFESFYAALRKNGASPATVIRNASCCSAAINMAIRYGWLRYNPAQYAKKPKQAKALKTRRDLPEVSKVLAVFEEAISADPVWGRFLFAKINLGARRGEVVGLQRQFINFEESTVSIEWQIVQPKHNSYWKRVPVKQDSQRTISVDPATMAVLQAQWNHTVEQAAFSGLTLKPDSYLWTDVPMANVPWLPDRTTQRFRRLRDRAGLELRLHDLRHINGTQLAAAGVDLETISFRLGHTRTSTTANFYIERVKAGDAKAAGLLAESLKRV